MENSQRKATVFVTGFVIVGSLVSVWWRLQTPPLQIDRTPIIAIATGVGEMMAEETAKVVHDQGRIVLVTAYDHERSNLRDDLWEAFHSELKKYGNIHVVATEVLPPDPAEGMPPSCSRTVFNAMLERQAQMDAIVFFTDLPEWPRVNPAMPAKVMPKFIALDNGATTALRIRYEGYFTSGLLAALIYPHQEVSSTTPKSPREWFNLSYRIYTPENYEALFIKSQSSGLPELPDR